MTRLPIAAAAAWLALVAPADAGILIEARIGDYPIRIVSDQTTNTVRVAGAAGSRLVDIDSRTVYLLTPGQPAQMVRIAALPPAADEIDDFVIANMGPGPRIADYPTTHFQIIVAGTVCTELYANLGLGMDIGAIIAAFEILDRLNAVLAGPDRPLCERVPYRRYSRLGWSMRVLDADAPVIETLAVDTAYAVPPDEIALPRDAVDVTDRILEQLRAPASTP